MTVKELQISIYGMLHHNWNLISTETKAGRSVLISNIPNYEIKREHAGGDNYVYEVNYWCKNCENFKYMLSIDNHSKSDILVNGATETTIRYLYDEIYKLVYNG